MTDFYITQQEASELTGFTIPEIERRLAEGKWRALIWAEITAVDGASIGFDLVAIPPEAVRHIIAESAIDAVEFSCCGGLWRAVARSEKSLLMVAVGPPENPFVTAKVGFFKSNPSDEFEAFCAKAQAMPCAREQEAETPAPVQPIRRISKKLSIETVALDYMRSEYRAAEFQSAAKFHKHLIKTAGVGLSPFKLGTGGNARRLFCPAAGSFFEEGTLGKIWKKIRDA
jgi:hypothetical protein